MKFNLYPDIDSDTQPSAQYEVKLEYRGPEQQRVPTQVLLPSGKGAGWTFDYYHFEYDEDLEQYFALLKEITTPFGAVETLEYWTKENGHRFLNDARPPLPRVKRHAVDPRFGQPEMVTTYEYTDNNYLGRGAGGITWRDDGLDNLYQFTGSDFEYGSTASHWLKAADDDSPGDNDPLPPVIDPMKEPKQNFLEKWQNVGFALIGAVVGVAFMFAFPPAGIGIVFAVAGGVVTAAGLGLAVAGTLTDNNTMAIAGIGLTALGGGLMSLASVGTRVSEAFRTPRKSVSSEGGSRRASVPTASDANNDSVNVVNPVQVAPENIPLATTDTQTNVVRRHSVSEISITANSTAPVQQTPQVGSGSSGGPTPPPAPEQPSTSAGQSGFTPNDIIKKINSLRHVDLKDTANSTIRGTKGSLLFGSKTGVLAPPQ
ncbi:hypothetical protein N7381_24990 [Pseudomonas asiatica]|uniref:hypothetical protein n=1 Tax=Pseudomonas asiatica TaxID=2219225 RepID=UPI00244D3F2A|nr:hypothetical protein [Pseudomonas asiatica]MDH0136493.1 hypothetical protein [Pseudomonas asiatica]